MDIKQCKLYRQGVEDNIARGVREDGRELPEERQMDVADLPAGGVLVRKYTGAKENAKYSSSGAIYTTVEVREGGEQRSSALSFFCSNKEVQTEIERIFKNNGEAAVDFLCAGRHRILIRMDLFVISDDGGMADLFARGVNHELKKVSAKLREPGSSAFVDVKYRASSGNIAYFNLASDKGEEVFSVRDASDAELFFSSGRLSYAFTSQNSFPSLFFIGQVPYSAVLSDIRALSEKLPGTAQ